MIDTETGNDALVFDQSQVIVDNSYVRWENMDSGDGISDE